MPAASSKDARRRLEGGHLPDLAGDVVLFAVLRDRRFRAHHQAGRRPRSRHRHVARQWRQGPLRARRRGADPALLQRLFRHALSAAQARQRRRPRPVAILRRDGELGRDLHLRAVAAARSGDHQRSAQAGRSSAPKRTKWRTCGSAISSPWRGGTISGSTRASRAGWRTRRPSISIPTGAPTSTRSPPAKKRWALDAFTTTHPIVQSIRTVEQANQAFDDITYDKGESVISMLEGFAGRRRVAAGHPQLHRQVRLQEHAHRRSVGSDRGRGRQGPDADRARFHHPAGHPAGPARRVALRQRADRRARDARASSPTTAGSRRPPVR